MGVANKMEIKIEGDIIDALEKISENLGKDLNSIINDGLDSIIQAHKDEFFDISQQNIVTN